jgi:predicted metal-dependent phosphoesterase TrpH
MAAMDITDLHCHSTASDGTWRPCEVIRAAKRIGLRAIALTDHDTLAGVPEAAEEAKHLGVEFIPGCEISLDGPPGTFHMIGLLVDPSDRLLGERLDFVRRGREDRNAQILEKLAALGIPMTQEEVDAEAGGDVVGRPHFARVLVKRGVVRDFKEAFDRFLGKNRPAYAERDRLSLPDAIEAIHGAGGVAAVAHPFTLGFPDDAATEAWFREAAAAGVDAIETEVTEHSRSDAERYRAMARRCGMLESGGSDFHGENKKNTDVGTGKGSLRVPYAFLEAMKVRAAARPRGKRA